MKNKLIAFSLLLFMAISCTQAQEVKQLSSTEANKMLQSNKSIVVLDVRTPEEYSAGHIKGAINIDIKQADAFDKIDKLDKNATYIVHCRTNHRSSTAVSHMKEKGFKNFFQMSDGFNGWSSNGLAIEK